jgi:hypothetical protein
LEEGHVEVLGSAVADVGVCFGVRNCGYGVDCAAYVGDVVCVVVFVVVRVEGCQGGHDGCFVDGVLATVG